MGFSITDFLRDVGKGAATVVAGASPAVGLGIVAGSTAGRLLTGGSGGARMVQATDNPMIPDVLEQIWNPDVAGGPGPFSYGYPAPVNTGGGCTQIPVTVQPGVRQVAVAPPGYVIVNCNGQKVAMLKPVARSLGKWKARRKPPIKVSDWRALMKADSTIRKLKTVTKKAGVIQRARGKR